MIDDMTDNISDSGCDCDENLPNANDFCPVNSECKQCKCLPAGKSWIFIFPRKKTNFDIY